LWPITPRTEAIIFSLDKVCVFVYFPAEFTQHIPAKGSHLIHAVFQPNRSAAQGLC
jgi:hypothetical protein